ncbi:MAG: DNA polymerase ligase N-terminal domain-containing protein [Actinomycetota bacterium]
MKLEKYWEKRKFEKTPEPRGEVKETGLNRFVVQKHQATRLHYDFRLEMDGVLKSWAVPKGIPTKRGIKYLAVEVEVHPVDYLDFQGIIPPGEYGAGTVEIWDSGEYELIERKPDRLEFILKGKRLSGKFVLILMRKKGKGNWLLFKA